MLGVHTLKFNITQFGDVMSVGGPWRNAVPADKGSWERWDSNCTASPLPFMFVENKPGRKLHKPPNISLSASTALIAAPAEEMSKLKSA